MDRNIMDFSPLGGDWEIKEKIGSGTYGTVYRAEKKSFDNKYECAIKHISIPPENMDPEDIISEGLVSDPGTITKYYDSLMTRFLGEINVCYTLKGNTNIVSYEDHYIIKRNNSRGYDIFIRMELLEGLNKYKSGHSWSENEIINLGIDMCSALEILKANNILHRDIKLSNIFISKEGRFKLGDFGEAKILSGIRNGMSTRGSYPYMSPEIYNGKEEADIRADIYSLGMVMYRLMNNNRGPFIDPYVSSVSSDDINSSDIRRFKGEKINPPCNCKNKELLNAVMRACEPLPENRWKSPKEFGNFLTKLKKSYETTENAEATISAASMINKTAGIDTKQNNDRKPIENITEYNMQTDNIGRDNSLNSVNTLQSNGSNKVLIAVIIALSVILVLVAGFLLGSFITNSEGADEEVSRQPMPEKPASGQLQTGTQTSSSESEMSGVTSVDDDITQSSAENVISVPELKKVKVVSYKNISFETVKSQLNQAGLIVDEPSYEYSRDVDSGKIINQSVAEGKEVEENTVIHFTVSRGPDFSSVPSDCYQVVSVVSSGSSADLMLYEYIDNGWSKIFSCQATVGSAGVGSNYGEGRNVTPKGTFPLGVVLSQKRMTYGMEWQPCSDTTVVIEDTASQYYNQIVDKSDLPSNTDSDPIGYRLTHGINNACIFIEHNGNGYSQAGVTKGAGSSITICGCYDYIGATAGCIDIDSSDMVSLLDMLDSGKNPYIKTE